MPRLWVFNQHYPPDALATAPILEAICKQLVTLGWDVTVFTGKPYLLPAHATWTPQEIEIRQGVRVVRLPSWNRRTGTPGRLLHYGLYAASAWAQWLRREPPDICLCLTTPPVLAGMTGVVGHLLRGVPFVYNTQDLFPDILETSRFGGGWIERIGKGLAWPVEHRAAAITPIGMQMAHRLAARRIPAKKLHIIPNPVDVEAIYPLSDADNPWLQALNLPEHVFRVVYAGNFGHAQGLDTVIESARILANRDDIVFLLVGSGDGKPEIAAMAEALPNVRILDFAPAAQVLSAGHVGLVPLKPGMGRFLVPSKATNYLAAGTPIIAAGEPDSDLAGLIRQSHCGQLVPPGDAAALAGAIRAAADQPRPRHDLSNRCRDTAATQFSGQVIAARYNLLLRSLLTRGGRVDQGGL